MELSRQQLNAVVSPNKWNSQKNIRFLKKAPVIKNTSSGRIASFLGNVDMRCGHLGLALISKRRGIDVKKLTPGNYVVFLNSSKNRIKVYAANNVVAYYVCESGTIDQRAIEMIPKAFNGSGNLDYDAALKAALEKYLAKKKRNNITVVR